MRAERALHLGVLFSENFVMFASNFEDVDQCNELWGSKIKVKETFPDHVMSTSHTN